MDIKNNNKALSATNNSAGIISQPGTTTTTKKAGRGPASGAGASAVGPDIMQEQKRQSENAFKSIGKGLTREKLSVEDLNGGLLDGALDDVDDEDLDGDTEDTEMAHDGDGVFAGQDNDDDERQLESSQQPGTEDESQTDAINGAEDAIVSSEDQGDVSHDDDDDEDRTAENEDEEEEEEEEEEEATPAAHSEDEGSELHDEESHHEGGDEDDDGIEDVEDVDEDDESVTPVAKKDIVPTFTQKAILNRPQPIAEELNSGDDLSDLSDFEDTDDSEEEEHSVTKGSGKDKTESAAVSETRAKNSRPAFGRKRSLREASRDSKGQGDVMKKEADDEYEENNDRQFDKESESEIAEGEEAEGHGKVECDDDAEEEEEEEEEEDLEKKHLHMDALQALTTIETEFATLRDKMYDERMRELDKEVKMINDGTHPELSTLMREIEEKREKRLRIAKAWRTHMGEIAQCGFEIKEYRAHCTFQSKKRQMRVDMITDLGRKQRKLMFEKALSMDSYRKNGTVSRKVELVRARKQRRSMVNELRTVRQQLHGFPASNRLPMVTSTELDEDFEAMGLPQPMSQTNSADHGPQLHLNGHPEYASLSAPAESSTRPSSAYRWTKPVEYTSSPRPGVDIYVDGNRCKVDGIWYKPNDAVAVLDAVYGQYNAKYLYQENDQIMLQRTDGSKTLLHLDHFRARKLYMQPRP